MTVSEVKTMLAEIESPTDQPKGAERSQRHETLDDRPSAKSSDVPLRLRVRPFAAVVVKAGERVSLTPVKPPDIVVVVQPSDCVGDPAKVETRRREAAEIRVSFGIPPRARVQGHQPPLPSASRTRSRTWSGPAPAECPRRS